MKTEEEIKQEIKELEKEYKKYEYSETHYAGLILGKIDSLEWVLEE